MSQPKREQSQPNHPNRYPTNTMNHQEHIPPPQETTKHYPPRHIYSDYYQNNDKPSSNSDTTRNSKSNTPIRPPPPPQPIQSASSNTKYIQPSPQPINHPKSTNSNQSEGVCKFTIHKPIK